MEEKLTVAYPKSLFKDVELAIDFGPLKNLLRFGSLNSCTEDVLNLEYIMVKFILPRLLS